MEKSPDAIHTLILLEHTLKRHYTVYEKPFGVAEIEPYL